MLRVCFVRKGALDRRELLQQEDDYYLYRLLVLL